MDEAMTEAPQSEVKENKADQTESSEPRGSGPLWLMLVYLGLLAIGGVVAAFFLTGGAENATSGQVIVVLAAFFTIIGTLAFTYLGIKASDQTTREIDRATTATDVYAQQLAKAKPENILEVAGAQTKLLTGYYRTVLAQARESFRWALVAAGIGLLFF